MHRQPKIASSPLRTLFRISATTLLALCTAWAADPLIQPEDISSLAESKLFISTHNHLQRVRLTPDSWLTTADGGNSWTSLAAPFAPRDAVRIAFHPEGKSQLFASSDRGDAAFFDGNSWWPVRLPEESVLVVGSAPPVLLQSLSANGQSTTRLLVGTPRGLRFANLSHPAGADSPDLNDSIHWQDAKGSTLPVTALALAPSTNRVAIGYASGLVAIMDGDPAIPTRLSASLPKAAQVVSLAFHPVNEADLLATLAVPSLPAASLARAAYHSLDAGENWVALTLPLHATSDPVALRVALPDGTHSLLASAESLVSLRDGDLLAAQQNPARSIGRLTAARLDNRQANGQPQSLSRPSLRNTTVEDCKLLAAYPLSLPAAGGKVSLAVSLTSQCGYYVRVLSSSPFVVVPTGVVNTPIINLTVQPNPLYQVRVATITLAGANGGAVRGGTVTIVQAARPALAPCKLTLTATPSTFPSEGGFGSLATTTTGDCPANGTVTFSSSGLAILQYGSTTFTVPQNMPPPNDPLKITPARSGTIQATLSSGPVSFSSTITITQDAYQLPPENLCVQDSEIYDSNITMEKYVLSSVIAGYISTGRYCRWNVEGISTLGVDKQWVEVKSTVNNIGPGSLQATVKVLVQPSRQGYFTVASRKRKVTQQGTANVGGCSSVSAKLDNTTPVGAGGGDRNLSITATPNCYYSLSLSGSTGMVSLLDPTDGFADGLLRIKVLPNTTGATRSLTFQFNHNGPTTTPVTLTQQSN